MVPMGFTFAIIATTLTLLGACLCFVNTYWLAALGWLFTYFVHLAFVAVLLGFCFALAWHQERLTGQTLIPIHYRVGIGIMCIVASIVSWVIVGFAVLIRM